MTPVVEVPTGDATLEAGIAALGLALNAAQCAQFTAYVALLAKWNKTFNLTAIREPQRMVTHHLLDAMAVVPLLPAGAGVRILDVGSGGGVPGIPFAIARPDARVVLVDSNQKKATFLMQAVIELGLRNVEVQAIRIEDYVADTPFDVVISRAFSDLAAFAVAAAPHVAPRGKIFAMKGLRPDEELASLPETIGVLTVSALEVPGLDAARHLIVMQSKERQQR